jgi:ParB family chromosome partitioning protein
MAEVKTLPVQEVISLISPDDLLPNPFQPATRIDIPEDIAKGFYESFERVGLTHFPVVRKMAGTAGKYEVADGWLRCAGFAYGCNVAKNDKYKKVPCLVRTLDNQQMADLVLESNLERKDLNPMEIALIYKRYLDDFHYTQESLSVKLGKSQGEISNSLRLLEAPEAIKEKVISQEITETHARTLLRLNSKPELQEKFLAATVKEKPSVSNLDLSINRELWSDSRALGPGTWHSPKFDTAECEKCPHRFMLADPWGHSKKEPRCTNPDCFDKKQKEQDKIEEKNAQEKLARLTSKEPGKKSKKDSDPKDDIIKRGEISSNQYEELRGAGSYEPYRQVLDNPEECATCPKKAKYNTYGEQIINICLNPICYRSKKSKKTREKNKADKITDVELTEKLGEIIKKNRKNRLGALQLAARRFFCNLSSAARDDVANMLPDLPKYTNGRLKPELAMATIMAYDEPSLVELIAACEICKLRRDSMGSEKYSASLKPETKMAVAIIENNYALHIDENKTFQERNCTGCNNADAALIATGEDCCKYHYARKIIDGMCHSSPAYRNDQEEKKAAKDAAADAPAGKKPAGGKKKKAKAVATQPDNVSEPAENVNEPIKNVTEPEAGEETAREMMDSLDKGEPIIITDPETWEGMMKCVVPDRIIHGRPIQNTFTYGEDQYVGTGSSNTPMPDNPDERLDRIYAYRIVSISDFTGEPNTGPGYDCKVVKYLNTEGVLIGPQTTFLFKEDRQ